MKNALLVVGLGVIILAGGWWYLSNKNTTSAERSYTVTAPQHETSSEPTAPNPVTENQGASIGSENAVEFACAGGKTMTAVFTRDILGLTLSDSRQMTLRQGVSASGIRYLNNTETVEFRGEGNDAYLMENGKITYKDCTAKL